MTIHPILIKSIFGTDTLHTGLWGEDCASLAQAQEAMRDSLLQCVPESPCRVLCVDSSLGAIAGNLSGCGHEVTALLPSQALMDYAQSNYPGPHYLQCSLLDKLSSHGDKGFDVIIVQEQLCNYPDLDAFFSSLEQLLKEKGVLVLCDEVVYNKEDAARPDACQSLEVERQLAGAGFIVQSHEMLGQKVTASFDAVLSTLRDAMEEPGELPEDELEKLLAHWQPRAEQAREGSRGFEFWISRKGQLAVRAYESGDETSILPLFNQVFNQNRSLNHWQWKFLNNPQGGPYITGAWEGSELAAHYAAYPVALTINGMADSTMHVGDTFTVPSMRGVGRGKTSLIGRVVRLFHKLWCEDRIDFFYGFNTGRIQKLGKNILAYEVIAPVYEFSCPASSKASPWWSSLAKRFSSYQAEICDQSGAWADTFFEQAKAHYPMLLTRDYPYLKWRYDEHPDYEYKFVLLKKAGVITGWSVIRQQDNDILLVDALVLPDDAEQLLVQTRLAASQLNKEGALIGWCSQTPEWWKKAMESQGFTIRRQAQELDLCVTFFSKRFSATDIRENFYYSMGDSDLY